MAASAIMRLYARMLPRSCVYHGGDPGFLQYVSLPINPTARASNGAASSYRALALTRPQHTRSWTQERSMRSSQATSSPSASQNALPSCLREASYGCASGSRSAPRPSGLDYQALRSSARQAKTGSRSRDRACPWRAWCRGPSTLGTASYGGARDTLSRQDHDGRDGIFRYIPVNSCTYGFAIAAGHAPGCMYDTCLFWALWDRQPGFCFSGRRAGTQRVMQRQVCRIAHAYSDILRGLVGRAELEHGVGARARASGACTLALLPHLPS